MTGVEVRAESAADADAIGRVIARAFADHPFSDQSEARIVEALRAAGALTVSLVAVAGSEIVGHVAFSPVRMSDGSPRWYGLAPVSVDPARQRARIGSALVRRGLDALRGLGAIGCVVLGDPAYYGRFGFELCPGLVYRDGPADHFQARAFVGSVPRGEVEYHAVFQPA